MAKKGIEQTKDLVLEAVALGNAIGGALEDKKIGFADIGAFIDPLTKLPAALAGISEVPAELADLDEDEKQELLEAVKDQFDLDDDKAEIAIEEGLALAAALHSYIQKVVLS